MPVPSQDGYVFCGWYDNAGYTGTAYTKIGAAEYGDKTCYGYFKDVQKPKLAASVESNVSPNTKGWYSTDQIRIALSYYDNKGVKSLYGKVDDGGYVEIPGNNRNKGVCLCRGNPHLHLQGSGCSRK